MISAIVAVDKNWGIGYQGRLLEHIPEDLKRFKELTQYNVVVMGRKTWESLPKKELPKLPERVNIIISNSVREYCCIGDLTFMLPLPQAIDYLRTCSENVFIIGGGQIYSTLLPYCNRVYVTKIDKIYNNVDTFFPNLDNMMGWTPTADSPIMEYNGINYQFWHYDTQYNGENYQIKSLW